MPLETLREDLREAQALLEKLSLKYEEQKFRLIMDFELPMVEAKNQVLSLAREIAWLEKPITKLAFNTVKTPKENKVFTIDEAKEVLKGLSKGELKKLLLVED